MTTLLTRVLAGAGGVFAPDRLPPRSAPAFHQLIAAQDGDGADDAVRVVVFGGEALNPTLLKPWLAREANRATRLVNMYGITETTPPTTHRPLTAADTDRTAGPIGQGLPDLRTYVLDRYLRPAPVGVSSASCTSAARAWHAAI